MLDMSIGQHLGERRPDMRLEREYIREQVRWCLWRFRDEDDWMPAHTVAKMCGDMAGRIRVVRAMPQTRPSPLCWVWMKLITVDFWTVFRLVIIYQGVESEFAVRYPQHAGFECKIPQGNQCLASCCQCWWWQQAIYAYYYHSQLIFLPNMHCKHRWWLDVILSPPPPSIRLALSLTMTFTWIQS